MKGTQGFASMHPDLQRSIASLGGKAVHKLGKGHKWTPEEAKVYGKEGGLVRAAQFAEKRRLKEVA